MKRSILLLVLLSLTLAACSRLREPSDAQLSLFLSVGQTPSAEVDARLSRPWVDCLRALSGDPELVKGLSIRYAGEDGKQKCRSQVEQRLADAARNPEGFSFAEMTAPTAVRRALAQLDLRDQSRSGRAREKSAESAMPPATRRAQSEILPPAAPDPSLDLGQAGQTLSEAEALCLQVQTQARSADDPQLMRFARYCGRSLRRLRATMEGLTRNKGDAQRIAQAQESAQRMIQAAHRALDAPAN